MATRWFLGYSFEFLLCFSCKETATGLLQVKQGHFRFVSMALFTITAFFPKVSFPPWLYFVFLWASGDGRTL